jgi:GNAT superfamily N-acetyltransferase
MGRLVGDGAMNFEIVDIAVTPAHQRRGLGRAIMARLMAHVRAMATPGACISLIADRGAEHLYAEFGFKPCLPDAQGMELFMPLAQG